MIIALRLTTIIRSNELENMVARLWQQDEKFFIKCIQKAGYPRTISITGNTLRLVAPYLFNIKDTPAVYLCRYIDKQNLVLSAERIAKRAKEAMTQCNIDTEHYKAASIRGASATQALRAGIPLNLVKDRGGWKSLSALEEFHLRAHLHVDWDNIMSNTIPQGESSEGTSKPQSNAFVLPKCGAAQARACPEAESAPHKASTKTLLWGMLVQLCLPTWPEVRFLARPGVGAPGRAKGSPG